MKDKHDILYWLWLLNKQALTYRTIRQIVKYYGSAKAVYEIKKYNINITEDIISALMNKSLDKAEKIYDETIKIGGYILTIDDSEYPDMLRNIADPPFVLYCIGKHIDWKNILTIGVVGTRRYTEYGKKAAEYICSGLAKSGIVVVSGMARGIDSVAAWASLNSGGASIAVLGSGLDVIYPPENVSLYNAIASRGVVITEFPPHTKPLGYNFPKRNRIIAGLSYGVLAVQAPEKSGALITANQAVDFGRNVYAVPSSIFDRKGDGTNKLIQQGAKLVLNAEDIIEDYPYFELIRDVDEEITWLDYETVGVMPEVHPELERNHKIEKKDSEKNENKVRRALNRDKVSGLNGTELEIVNFLESGEKHLDEICRQVGKHINEVNASMIVLELSGYVVKQANNMFKLNDDITQLI